MELPGLLTSKLLIIIILGCALRFLRGIGMLFIDWQTASILYSSWAEIGIMGEFLQSVSLMNYLICL